MLFKKLPVYKNQGSRFFSDQFLDLVNHAEKLQYEKERLIEQQRIRMNSRMNSKESCIPIDL